MAKHSPAPEEIDIIKRVQAPPSPSPERRPAFALARTCATWWRRMRAWAKIRRGCRAAARAPLTLPEEIERDLWAGLAHPAAASSDHRWGSPCHSCEMILTPVVVDPHDYRRCRLCGVLRKLLRAQRAPSAGSDLERDRALFRALLAYRQEWAAAIKRRMEQAAP